MLFHVGRKLADCLVLAFGNKLRVDVHRGSDARVPHLSLYRFVGQLFKISWRLDEIARLLQKRGGPQ